MPLRPHSPTLDDVLRFHLEDVREIGANGQFHHEDNFLPAVIDNFKFLVDSFAHRAIDRQAKRVCQEGATIRFDSGVGEMDARSVEC